MQRYLALGGIVLLVLALPQVYCGYESLSYIIRPLNATETCLNVTTHPSMFKECPLPPYPIVNKDYSDAQKEVPNIAAAKNALTPDCYDMVLKTICIMSVQICTADRYSVGMFGYDVCMHYMACGVASVGKPLPEQMCVFLSNYYTSTIYDGTDPPTYYVAGKPREETGRASSALYTSLVPQIIMIALVLQLFAKHI